MNIDGHCDPRFRAVHEEFERNFRERGEVGASVCVTVGGETVVDLWGGLADRHARSRTDWQSVPREDVDLWGGLADPHAGTPWDRDTLVLVWSCTKGATALCAHVLHARGLLDYDAPVAHYWPAFAQAGKEAVTVRMLLDHQAGLPAVRQPLAPGGLYDWQYMTDLLAAEAPFWPPGTRQGYHAVTFGHLVGEVVRRVSGKPFDAFFREEVAGPLGLDFHIGLPEEDEGRVAPTIRADPPPRDEPRSPFLVAAFGDRQSIQSLTVLNTGRRPGDQDSRAAHRAVLPGQGGITNARGLAGLYAPLALGGAWGGVRLVDEETLGQLGAVHSAVAVDATLLIGTRFALGFWKSSDNRKGPPGAREGLILSEAAFGHPGMGGSLGFADPAARMSFGYAMNKQGRGVCLNERGQGLVDATYRSLGYRTNRAGRWA